MEQTLQEVIKQMQAMQQAQTETQQMLATVQQAMSSLEQRAAAAEQRATSAEQAAEAASSGARQQSPEGERRRQGKGQKGDEQQGPSEQWSSFASRYQPEAFSGGDRDWK